MNLPLPVLFIFVASTAFLAFGAIGFASRRVAVTVLALSVVAIAIPLVIGTIRWPYFQGRYMFPFTVGLPVVAGLGVGEGLRGRSMPRRLLWLLLSLLAFAQIISFAQSLRRFVVGASADWWIYSTPRWRPPLDPSLVVVGYVLATVALYGRFYALAHRARTAEPPRPTVGDDGRPGQEAWLGTVVGGVSGAASPSDGAGGDDEPVGRQ